MSFGYSVGDAIAIAGAIERIMNELKSYHAAPLHFQRLAIELSFLSTVCKQVFELRPSLPNESAQIERIRAIALQCLGPLQEFEGKMAKYENTLGSQPPQGNSSSRKRKRERIKDFGRQLHWSAIARHDVDELRAILTSEILAINTLLTMQEWDSLKSQALDNRGYATQLKTLIESTGEASSDIKQFLVDARTASEHLERLIVSGNMTQREQARILNTIKDRSKRTQKSVKDLFRWQRRYTSIVHGAVDDVSKQVVKLFSLKNYMETWIKNIVQHCKDIIAMVERNTQLLLSLHGMMTKLSVLLNQSGVSLPILEFENPFGHKMALPYQLCETWEEVILGTEMLENHLALGGEATISRVYTLKEIDCFAFKALKVIDCSAPPVHADVDYKGLEKTAPLKSCGLWWSSVAGPNIVIPSGSQLSSKHGIPTPPNEAGNIWNISYTNYVRKQISSTACGRGVPSQNGIESSFEFTADEVDGMFRRVHVDPIEEDPLRALNSLGQRCYGLMIEPSASTGHTPDPVKFAAIFEDILHELEDLRLRGFNPYLELSKRRGTAEERQNFELWLKEMAEILKNTPHRKGAFQNQKNDVVTWLTSRGKWGFSPPPGLVFDLTDRNTFKNSHLDVAHYNNPNFQPNLYPRPEDDEQFPPSKSGRKQRRR